MSDNPAAPGIRAPRTAQPAFPIFDPDAAPANPVTLVQEWLAFAVAGGVSQPKVMTLATASAAGIPSARSLLLQHITDEGFWFASLADTPKGRELAENPCAALTLYWREHGRQVRVSGAVTVGPRETAEGDFRARHPNARARAIAGEQSEVLPPIDEMSRLIAGAASQLDGEPEFVPQDWTAYVVAPDMVEFWQAAAGHEELRLRYRREGAGWAKERLWP
ncbi:MAG: pyridoxal 5'-phosphate synthase [Microbacteriaceae bacterium]|nr:pyridoxal 5'-phosphate synthase [Microbacteriaceae bacterium]